MHQFRYGASSFGLEERSTESVFLHSRHVILFSFFSTEHCMSEPHRGRVELYLWGAAIGFGRSRHTTICCSLSGSETPGRYNPPPPPQSPNANWLFTLFFSAAPPRVAEEVPPPIESDGEDEVEQMTQRHRVLLLPQPAMTSAWEPCPWVFPMPMPCVANTP